MYGNPAPEFTEAGSNPTLALADFVGIAIHCAKNAAPCQGNVHARPDDQTTVPGSNDGYLGLFGAKYVNPAITGGNPCVNDTTGQPNVRPTMLSVLGLADTYVDDGRVLQEVLSDKAVSKELHEHDKTNEPLAAIDKQLNAPFGQFGLATLASSTKALASTDTLVYDSIEAQIASLTQKRDDVAGAIHSALDGAAFRGVKLNEDAEKVWIEQAQTLPH